MNIFFKLSYFFTITIGELIILTEFIDRCREIFEGNGEKYYNKMQRNILRRAEKCYAVSCEAKSLFGNFDLKESREENIENANSRLGHLQKY